MRKILAVLFFLGGWAIVSGQDAEQVLRDRGEVFFWFSRPHNLSVHQLTQIISIDRVKGDSVFAYANAEEYKALLALGIRPNILTAPSLVYKQKMQAPGKGAVAWDSYPTYEGYLALMAGYAASFPDICRLDTIGTSVNGRYLLALKLSDSAKSDQPEPEVFYTSSIHGDETTGYGLLLHLIDTLVTSYGTSPRLTRMLDSLEIWINPLANPDGTYYSGNASVTGATRYNANGYDLNRNFPDIRYQDDTVWQPETRAMINFMQQRRFVLSANFHGGAEVMNYPWDTWVTRHPDTDWFEFISHLFADTSMYYGPEGYFKDTYPSGVTNGYDWYDVYGGRQDFTTYALRGREITIEISGIKLIPSSSLHAYWDYNRRSLINYLEQAMYGIQGYVVDSATGVPLHASVEVLNHDLASANSSVWSDSVTGRFTRLIAAGNWDLVFSVPGYPNDTLQNVQVQNFTTSWLQVKMGNGKSQHIKPEISTGEEIRLWPVPAGDKLQISFMISGNNNCKVRITDISGREQLRQEFTGVQGVNNLLLQTSGLSNGNYVLDLVAGNRKYQAVRFTILRTP